MGERTVERVVEEEEEQLKFYCDFCGRDEEMVDSEEDFISLVQNPKVVGRPRKERGDTSGFVAKTDRNDNFFGLEYIVELISTSLYHLCPECAGAFFEQFEDIDHTEKPQ